MKHRLARLTAALLTAFTATANANLIASINYSSCDAFCTNPVNVNQSVSDTSLLSFSDSRGSVSAQTNYGLWKASGTSSYVGNADGSSATATSTWNDTIQFIGSTGTAIATIKISIDGTAGLTNTGHASEAAGMNVNFLFNGQPLSVSLNPVHAPIVTGGTFDGEVLTGAFSFNYGQSMNLGGTVDIFADFGGFSLFGNTVTLEFTLPTGASIESQEGATYQIASPTVSVPVPTTASLLVIGLAGLALNRRKRT